MSQINNNAAPISQQRKAGSRLLPPIDHGVQQHNLSMTQDKDSSFITTTATKKGNASFFNSYRPTHVP
jgi:hypothetical protein